MAKRVPKASKRRLMLFGPLSLIVIAYFLFTLVSTGYRLISLATEEKQLKEKLVSLQAEEESLKIEIQKLKDPDYLARYARENYLYSKDGEYIIKLEEQEEVVEEENFDKYYEYIIYGAGVVIIIVFIYIIRKNKKK